MKTKQILLIAIICLLPQFLFSQTSKKNSKIIYTEFEPDYLIENTSCVIVEDTLGWGGLGFCDSIDIDYDGIWDIRFWFDDNSAGGSATAFKMNYEDNMMACDICDCDNDKKDNLSEFTYDNIEGWWWYYEDYCEKYCDININVAGHECKMGFRKSVGDGWCYGWLRYTIVVLPKYSGITYKLIDMAYCTIPDYPFKFGQKAFDDEEYESEVILEEYESEVILYPNPVEDKLSLSGYDACECIDIYGIDGRLLKSHSYGFDNIDVSTLPAGIYIAKILLKDGDVLIKKVLKN